MAVRENALRVRKGERVVEEVSVSICICIVSYYNMAALSKGVYVRMKGLFVIVVNSQGDGRYKIKHRLGSHGLAVVLKPYSSNDVPIRINVQGHSVRIKPVVTEAILGVKPLRTL